MVSKTRIFPSIGRLNIFLSTSKKDLAIVDTIAVDDNGNIIDEYPEDRVKKKLCRILDSQEPVDVVSDFLSIFNINGGAMKIVVENYQLEQQTHSNRQIVSIQAITDYDYTVYYEEI